MFVIAHRANLEGPSAYENHPFQIEMVTNKYGLYAEVDVWLLGDRWMLGHDFGEYIVNYDFLRNPKIICHCKNLEALYFFTRNRDGIHYFWHENDNFTLTSKQYIWTYPGARTCKNSIVVDNDFFYLDVSGICTDYPIKLLEKLRTS